ncbi:uncharacterized protein [Cicer arietinum]|uniref:Uncharacterized protein LOC101505283 isoform X2 n=1 Tax=Cicer arietinum TaxID=3827 RepID=A0A1S2XK90_CICAR|nr:uncharacterized protein LOC101505283 isoform X2 [Cicer arietinum]
MPLEPIPLDRKNSYRERKQGSSESLGSVARWRGSSSHHHQRRAADFRRFAGHHRKQGGWQLFPEESGHERMLSRSCDKMLEEDNCRPSVSRGDGKYGRGNKESKGAFSQREWRGRSWETTNSSLNTYRRQIDVNNDRRSVDDMLTYSSHPNSDLLNTWEQHHMKDQHDKMGGVNRFGSGQKCDRNNALGTIDWKPLKWTRPGYLSSRESGLSHSISTRSLGGTNSKRSCEGKVGLHHKIATGVESNSGEAARLRTSSAPSEEANLRKKPRLNWGEGLAKFEKKKVEGPEVTLNKDDPVSPFNMEPNNFLSPGLVDKNAKVSGFSDCASPATPSSAACSSSPGTDDKLFGNAANVDSDVSNLRSSPGPGGKSHLQMFSFNLEKVDIDSLSSLGSSLVELPQSDDPCSVDDSLLRSTTMNKLLTLKAGISKVLEVTETEIDLLETELRSLKSESEGRFPCSAAVGSLMCYNVNSCEEHVGSTDKVARLEPLQIVSSDEPIVEMAVVEKMPLSTNLLDIHDNCQEDDNDCHGAARSELVEPLPMMNAVSACDAGYGTCSEDLGRIQSTTVQCLIPCTYRHVADVSACGDSNSSLEVKDGVDDKSSERFYSSTENILYDTIISCNKKSAKAAWEEIAKLLPEECGKKFYDNIGVRSASCSQNGVFIMAKFEEKRRFTRLKERVITLKFKALHHLWKEDMRLLSVRKHRPKSHKKLELDLRTTSNSHQKKRSSIPFRFPFPGNQLRLVPTSEMINYTSQLLSESKHEIQRSFLKMPALILDQKDKMNSMFLSSNGLVEDPLAIEKERAMINPWTSEEKEIFLEKYVAFGKDFRRIASFLDHKTTADCVEFYYKNHKSDFFVKIKKKNDDKLGKFCKTKADLMASGIKWDSEVNASSLDILSAASVMATRIAGNRKMRSGSSLWRGYGNVVNSKGDNIITQRMDSVDVLQDERETVAADVLASICGCISSEATNSCITSSVDPVEDNRIRKCVKVRSVCKQTPMDVTQNIDHETCSDESCGEMDPTDWTDGEKASFLQAVSSFGKDFAMIAQCVRTRSQYQCKVFFSKTQKRLKLDLMGPKPENVGSLVNDDVDGGRSDADNACAGQTGSVNGTDTSGTKTDVNQPASDKNMYHDESNPVEASNLSAELDESEETNGKVDHEDVNMVSNPCVIGGESKLGIDGDAVVLNSSDKSGSVRDQRAIVLSDSIEIGEVKTSEGEGAVIELVSDMETVSDSTDIREPSEGKGGVTELVSDMKTIEPCHSYSVAEGRLVSDVSSRHWGNELEGSTICLVDRDEANTDVVIELKDNVHDSSTPVNTSLSSVEVSCSRLGVDVENEPQLPLEKPHFSGSSVGPLTNANSILQYTDGAAVQYKKTASQDLLSCDIQGNRDTSGHNSSSNLGYQLCNPGNLLDDVEPARILQCYDLQVSPKKEVNVNMSCSSSATQLTLLSQKIEHDDQYKSLQCFSDSEKTPRDGDVKLFGKILTIPSSTQKPVSSKGNEENCTHRPKLSSASSSLKLTSLDNAGGKSAILKVEHDDCRGIKNVPVTSYHVENKIHPDCSSLPDSAILLAKYPAAFSSYSTSAILEKESLQALAKNDKHHLNGASSFTTREVNGCNGVIDYQMCRDSDDQKEVLSDMQRRNGIEAISSCLQRQGKGMVGTNGVGKADILVGGSKSVIVSDPEFVGQTGSVMKEDDLGS